jgi:hypothetical protein
MAESSKDYLKKTEDTNKKKEKYTPATRFGQILFGKVMHRTRK